MSGSESKSQSSSSGSSKSRINYVSSAEGEEEDQFFILSPRARARVSLSRSAKRFTSDSPQSVLLQLEDYHRAKNSATVEKQDDVLVSPRRSQRSVRSVPRAGLPGDPLLSPTKNVLPPSGRSSRDTRTTGSPRRYEPQEDSRTRSSNSNRSSSGTRSRDHRSSSRGHRSSSRDHRSSSRDHRSSSRSRRHSTERDTRSDKVPSSPRTRDERYYHSSSRERTSDSRSRTDRSGYDCSRTHSRDRNSDSRSRRDHPGYESSRNSNRDRSSSSPYHRPYDRDRERDRDRDRDRDRARSRDNDGERYSSKSRSHADSDRYRSESRSRKVSPDDRTRSRSSSRERKGSPDRNRNYSSSRYHGSSSRVARSPRTPRDERSPRTPSRYGLKARIDPSKVMQINLCDQSVSSQGSSEPSVCTNDEITTKVRASVILQTAWRCYLAVTNYQTRVQKRNETILETKTLQKRKDQEDALKEMEVRLQGIETRKIEEIAMIKATMRAEKRILKDRARRKFEKHIQKLAENQQAEQEALESLNHLEIEALTEESKSLEATIKDLEANIDEIKEANSKLEQTNSHISELFASLNDFARRKTESKRKLILATQKVSKVYKPKIKEDLMKSVLACQMETRLKENYRCYLYKIAQGLQTSDAYDHVLYEDVMKEIKECEDLTGSNVMTHNEAIDYMNMVETNAKEVQENETPEDTWWASSADMNYSTTWGASGNASEANLWNSSACWTESQFFASSAWGNDDNWANAQEDGWSSGDNLEKLLEKTFELDDIDCQSHNSWRTEHEDLMSCVTTGNF